VVLDLAHLAFTILVASRFKVPRLYKGAHAAPGFDDARAFKLQIDLATVLALMRRSTASCRTVGN
jgi:hypothetical protein